MQRLSKRLFSLLFGAVIFSQTLSSAEASKSEKPNIIFIIADDLGSHDVGWRGSEIKTPNLDALARGGAQLNQFYVQPVCSPTRAAFLTGRYPFRYGFQTGVVKPWAQYGLPLEERLLPQALKEVGYKTAITGKWHLGHFAPEYLPTKRGFDHQYGHYNGALDYFTHIRDGGFDWHRDDKVNHDEGYSTELVGREAARLIRDREKDKPLFLYVPFNGVHTPLQVPESYSNAYPNLEGKRKIYAGMVTALDDAVGKIVEAVRDEKIGSNTLIIFSSDNGGPNPGTLTSNGPLRAGKATVYEGGVRVCAFANWEGKIKPGTVINEAFHIVDWYPTLLKLTGASLEQKLPVDGLDIWPVLTENKPSPHESILLNTTPNNGAIRVGDWKLVVRSHDVSDGEEETAGKGRKGKGVPVELFNLADDVSEKINLASAQPEKVKELRAQYDVFAKQAVSPKSEAAAKDFKAPKVWGEAP